jgi:predicted SnoaL-like aldol condensation-catalyzing enzyme
MSIQQQPRQALGSRVDNADAAAGPENQRDHVETQGTNERSEGSQPVTTVVSNNMHTVRALMELAFNERQPLEAAATYLDVAYRQHHPTAWGPAAFVRLAEGYLRACPELHLTIQLLVADGDWVVAQSLIQRYPSDRGRQVMDTFQLANGRVVEHWDVMRELPENVAVATSVA